MRFTPTAIDGCLLVDLDPRGDDRGFLARAHCRRELSAEGLEPHVEQINLAHTRHAGTVRGLHYQVPPWSEAKLVRCVRGAVFDVAVDVREESPTFLQHIAVELSADNRRALFVSAGLAHGYQAVTDDAELLYTTSAAYTPAAERGLHYGDSRLGIEWPMPAGHVSAKDQGWGLIGRGWSSDVTGVE